MSPIIQTGDQALAEENGEPAKTGPASLMDVALASENSGFVDGTNVTNPTRVMVIGATDFLGDAMLKNFGTQVYNIYTFYYSVQWMLNVKDTGLLITAKALPSYQLTGGSNTTYWIGTILCIILLPLAFLITALIVYRKRKNL